MDILYLETINITITISHFGTAKVFSNCGAGLSDKDLKVHKGKKAN